MLRGTRVSALLGPLLDLLGPLDHLLRLVAEVVTYGRLQAVAM
jgi:hypothetical protein